MKKCICILLVLAMLLPLSACSKINSLLGGGEKQDFSYPIGEMPESIDPQIAEGEAALIVIENCMEGLVRLNTEGEVIPAIASSWDIAADGLTYTFHLNRDAHWSVDTEDEDFEIKDFKKNITAEDFVFAVSRAVRKETNAPDFQSVSLIKNAQKINQSGSSDTASLGIRALDSYTLEIELESANSDFLKSLTAAVFMPCSEQFFDYCSGRYGRGSAYFLSNGGFKLRAWNETNIVLRKDEEYTLPNAAQADSVTLYRDENAFESFMNDNYDALAIEDDHIDEALADKSLSVQQYDDTVWSFAINCGSTLGSNVHLRQALMSAVDTSLLTAPEWGTPASGAVPNICTAGGENYRQSAGKGAILPYSVAEAGERYQRFLKAYKSESESEELPVFQFLCTAALEQNAKKIAQCWQTAFGTGFEIKITVLPLEELSEQMRKGKYDGAIAPISADTADALVFLKKFAAENTMRYSSAAFEKQLNSDKTELEKCAAAENILLEDGVLLPLFCANSYYVQRDSVSGIYFYAFGGKVNFLQAQRVK